MDFNFNNYTGFDWNEGNIQKNEHKHNVFFWECEQIFFNSPIVIEDIKHSTLEKRWAVFGITDNNRYITVVFTNRNDLIRVISARDMNKKEREFYNNEI